MAEASGALVAYQHTHAIKAILSDAGLTLTLTFTIPGPRRVGAALRGAVLGFRDWVWPATTPVSIGVLSIIAMIAAPHVTSLAEAAVMGLAALVLLAASERSILQWLFRQQDFLFPAPGASSVTCARRLWAGAISVLTRGSCQTMAFQSLLPRAPVPPLRSTIVKYLESARCTQDAETFARTLVDADDFLALMGPRIQLCFWVRSLFYANPTTDWWTRFVYLRGRDSLVVNSNYYGLACARFKPIVRSPSARAAVISHALASFHVRLRNRSIAPIRLGGGIIPICMAQYDRAFGTTRVPGREEDELVTK